MPTTYNQTQAPQITPRLDPQQYPTTYAVGLRSDLADSPQILTILNNLGLQFANSPYVREMTVSLLQNVGNNNVAMAIQRIINFVRNQVQYLPDPQGVEYVISPVNMLQKIQATGQASGDCDDHVLLLISMLGSISVQARAVGVKLYEDRYDHVVAEYLQNGQWNLVDPCAKSGVTPNYREKLV